MLCLNHNLPLKMPSFKLKPSIVILVDPNINQWFTMLDKDDYNDVLTSVSLDLDGGRILVFSDGVSEDTFHNVVGSECRFGDIYVTSRPKYANLPGAYVFPRYPKDIQAFMLHRAAAKLGLEDFVTLPAYTLKYNFQGPNACTTLDIPHITEGLWIVRPTNGARSIGQIIIDCSRIELQTALTQISEEMFSDPSLAPAGVIINKGTEFCENESVAMLRDGMFLQKVQERVVDEYRVIVGLDSEIELVMARPTKEIIDNETRYSCVSMERDITVLEMGVDNTGGVFKGQRSEQVFESLSRLIVEAKIPAGSIDVFTTYDEKTNSLKWGIFEFSNQFTLSDMQPDVSRRLMKRWFTKLLKKHFSS